MKTVNSVIASVILLAGVSSHATKVVRDGAGRPGQQLYACLSTPVKGDGEVAAGMLDRIDIFENGDGVLFVMHKGKDSESIPAEIIQRVGGVSYVIQVSKNTNMSLSIAQGKPSKKVKATFQMMMDASTDLASTSTYTCRVP